MTKKLLAIALVVLVAVSAFALPGVLNVSAADENYTVDKKEYDAYVETLNKSPLLVKFTVDGKTEYRTLDAKQQLDPKAYAEKQFADASKEIGVASVVDGPLPNTYIVTTTQKYGVTVKYAEIGTTKLDNSAIDSTTLKVDSSFVTTKFAKGDSYQTIFAALPTNVPAYPGSTFSYWSVENLTEAFNADMTLKATPIFKANYVGISAPKTTKFLYLNGTAIDAIVDGSNSKQTEIDAVLDGSAITALDTTNVATIGVTTPADAYINYYFPGVTGGLGLKTATDQAFDTTTSVKKFIAPASAAAEHYMAPNNLSFFHKPGTEAAAAYTYVFDKWVEKEVFKSGSAGDKEKVYVATYKKTEDVSAKYKFEIDPWTAANFKVAIGTNLPTKSDYIADALTTDITKILTATQIAWINTNIKDDIEFKGFKLTSVKDDTKVVTLTPDFDTKISSTWYFLDAEGNPSKEEAFVSKTVSPTEKEIPTAKGWEFVRWTKVAGADTYNSVYKKAVEVTVYPEATKGNDSFAFASTISGTPKYNKTSTLRVTAGKGTFTTADQVALVNKTVDVKFTGVNCKVAAGTMTEKSGTPVKVTWNKKGSATVIASVAYNGKVFVKTYTKTIK